MTSEKRKMQNRQAQRLYRERKKQRLINQIPDPASSVASSQAPLSSAVFPAPTSSHAFSSPPEHQASTLVMAQPHLLHTAWTDLQSGSTSYTPPGNPGDLAIPDVNHGTFLGDSLPQRHSAPEQFGQHDQAWNMDICTEPSAQRADLTFTPDSPSDPVLGNDWTPMNEPVQQRSEGLRKAMDTQAGQTRTGGKEALAGRPHQRTSADPFMVLRRLEERQQIGLDIMVLSRGRVPIEFYLELFGTL
ncbi:hypothetical protein CCHR01_19693 [Colletotrichum chrysophilum]|uniref:BZIP domain-containing protein n=1 Tax=Colletotrichum chrysophilum TaxID=1836956 RepID=A0AAD8ZYI9_9PEZI|nr:hypothetical protein CCHR01_19693 [Colletotrichum chrysophilum]